jgi:ABC-type transport system substrate-binding protein
VISGSVAVIWTIININEVLEEPNEAPVILDYYPLINPSINDTAIQFFNISAFDPNADFLTYGWYVNGVKVDGNASFYTFEASSYPIGTYSIQANITDGEFYINHAWTLTILLEGEVLRVATRYNPVTMDPVDSWDKVSYNMLDQVVETLIAYNLSDPTLPLVGRLAESWDFRSTEFGTNITFQLRDNVYFHDGSKLDGYCVLHTFERINYFGNATGTLDPATHTMAWPHSLYKFRDGKPIFNHSLSFVNPIDDLEVTLVLNAPYGPVEGLLVNTASAIVHPDSTPVDRMLELGSDLVIGTGPFKLIGYYRDTEVRFERWEGYWNSPAFWDRILYTYYNDDVTANNAMFAHDIDFLGQGLASLKPDFEADPDITVTGDGVNEFINGSIYWYIAFNRPYINQTWRKAISYAFNYSYFITDIELDTSVRANSLVPPGFPAHNSTTTGAYYDIPKARQIMQNMGFGVGWEIGTMNGDQFIPGADEAQWTSAEFIPNFGNFTGNEWNFRHRLGSFFMELLIQRFTQDMDLIGIQITPQPLTWDEFIRLGQLHPDRLHIYFLGWGPDYYETFNMIDPLVNTASHHNYARINDPQINLLLDAALSETNTVTRYQIYKRLQSIIIDKRSYHMPLMYDKLYFVHATSLKGVPYNSMEFSYWYPTYRV